MRNRILFTSIVVLFSFFTNTLISQTTLPSESEYQETKTRVWINTYGIFRVSNRLFWDAQTHFRFQETPNTPYIGQLAQIYNRHAIGYIYNEKINFSVGGVLRIDYNTSENPTGRNSIPEYRIWHQYQFAQPLYTAMFYHRIRIEHRWTRGFQENSDYIFRNRWRYMARAKIPLNNNKLVPETWYLSPEAELIMQSGKEVIGSPMEDLRLKTSLGYIVTPRLSIAAGMMYSFGQTLDNPGIYNQAWTFRLHFFYSPELRKIKNRIPAINLFE